MKAVKHLDPEVHEPSAWLRGRIAARIAQVRARGLDPDVTDPLIVAPLGRTGEPGSREDRSCDRCGVYVAPPARLWMLQQQVRPGLLLIGGLCTSCLSAEGVSTDA